MHLCHMAKWFPHTQAEQWIRLHLNEHPYSPSTVMNWFSCKGFDWETKCGRFVHGIHAMKSLSLRQWTSSSLRLATGIPSIPDGPSHTMVDSEKPSFSLSILDNQNISQSHISALESSLLDNERIKHWISVERNGEKWIHEEMLCFWDCCVLTDVLALINWKRVPSEDAWFGCCGEIWNLKKSFSRQSRIVHPW